MIDDRWLICPLCGWGKKYKTEKKTKSLNVVDPESGPFIDHRDLSGGRGSGFARIYVELLEDIKNNPEYEELIDGLRDNCLKILDIIGTGEAANE